MRLNFPEFPPLARMADRPRERLLSRCNEAVVENGQGDMGRGNGFVRRHCLVVEEMANGEELVRNIREVVFDVMAIVWWEEGACD